MFRLIPKHRYPKRLNDLIVKYLNILSDKKYDISLPLGFDTWGDLFNQTYIAGGCLRDCFLDVQYKDIDMYIKPESKDLIERTAFIKNFDLNWSLSQDVNVKQLSINLYEKNMLSIITLPVRDIEDTLSTFDFINNMMYYDFAKSELWVDVRVDLDNLKQLVFNQNTLCVTPVLNRGKRFSYEKGMNLSNEEVNKIIDEFKKRGHLDPFKYTDS